jgi:ribosomal protein L35
MPKLKTRKVISKRVQAKKSGKVEFQTPGKAHFNARNGGNKNRRIRKDGEIVNKKDTRNIKRALGTA